MQEPKRPLTKKDQVALNEDLARNIQAQLDAEIIEEDMLERQKQEEANIALIELWENTQAMIEANRLLAERLQTREREELTDEEKGKLFMELIKKRRKHFDALRAQKKRNRSPTKAQNRSQMSTYLKHMESNEKKVKGSEEKVKSSRKKILGMKRARKEQQQESPKRQKIEDDKETDKLEEVEADDTDELKKHLVIVKDDDIAIDAIPLATKRPVIVNYKLLKEGIMAHYQLIRADGSSKRYSLMIRLLQGIDREDLQTLWKVKTAKAKHIEYLELGDRMERAATTASSLEVEQDSVNAARFNLLLSVQVNTVRHMLMLPVQVPAAEENPAESEGFEQIVDFLNVNPIRYALIINLTIYISCIQQFWDSAKLITVNRDVHIQALIEGKKIIVNEASIRCDLKLEDAEGSPCLPNATIFEELTRIGGKEQDFFGKVTPLFDTMMVQTSKEKKQKPRRKQRTEAEVPQDETHEKSVPTPYNDPLPSGEDRMQLTDLMVLCTKLQKQVLALEKAKSDQAIEIASLKNRVEKLEKRRKLRTTRLQRLKKRRIEDLDADAEVTLLNETQERQDEDLMFDTSVLDGDEMFVDVTTGKKQEQSTKVDDMEVSTAGEVVTTASEAVTTIGVKDSAAPTIPVTTVATTIQISKDKLTLDQTMIEIKEAKLKAITTTATTVRTKPEARGISIQESSDTTTRVVSTPLRVQAKDKGKEIMVEPEIPLKKKDQIALDEQLAFRLHAEEQAQLEKMQKERDAQEEANMVVIEKWNEVQAKMEVDMELAQRLQSEEQE
ncbi:hypothetical protein Tco_1070536 [Tanacetum coccineum]|uniref:Uncharacterized protein n=1 Tax=Tanacetum coccineum TaxID=301880 RepID=A0ABQ5HMU3_9ASTR